MSSADVAQDAEHAATSRPARVLFVHPSDELYGSDLSLLTMLRGLDRGRFEPLVVLANDVRYEGALSRELAAAGIECRHLDLAVARRQYLTPLGLAGFLRRLRASSRMLARLIRDERIDLVHTNTLAVWSGALAARRARRPHIWHIHEQLERPRPLRLFLQRFVPAHSAHVVGVSRAALDAILVTPAARAKSSVIPNDVAAEPWMAATGRERIRAELGCGPDDVLLGMVSRVSRMKGTDLCVQAVARLLAAHPTLRCFIAGGTAPGQSEMLDDVRRLIAASPAPDHIHLLGLRHDAPDLMAALDVLVAPSRYGEGASLTIIQAMCAGKPVVASDLDGNIELVVDGVTGCIVPHEDVAALAAALARLAADPELRAAMGRAGQERALRLFTVKRQVNSFNALLAAICPTPAGVRR